MERRKSFEDLSDQPIMTRVPDSSWSRLKALAKDPSRRSLNALTTEIMPYFIKGTLYEKGLKFRIPHFTIRFEKGNPVRMEWRHSIIQRVVLLCSKSGQKIKFTENITRI